MKWSQAVCASIFVDGLRRRTDDLAKSGKPIIGGESGHPFVLLAVHMPEGRLLAMRPWLHQPEAQPERPAGRL